MPYMEIFDVKKETIAHTIQTTVLLIDKQQQHLLPLQLNEHTLPGPLTARDAISTALMTGDLLITMLHALGGNLEEVELELLPNDHLYAKIHLRDQHGLHTIQANLNDAIHLLQCEPCRVQVPDSVLQRQATTISHHGPAGEQRIMAIKQLAEHNLASLHKTAPGPLNLDFSEGFRGWILTHWKEYRSYALDDQISLNGKTSLAITLHKPYLQGSPNILLHEEFSAESYRGKRVRLVIAIKSEDIDQPTLELRVSWPSDKISPITGKAGQNSRLTHSRITPHPGDNTWTCHELVLDIPEQAQKIDFAVQTSAQGKLWLNDIEFTIVDRSTPLTGTIVRPPSTQPLNLDFSEDLEYWVIEGNTHQGYEYGVDTAMNAIQIKSVRSNLTSSCTLQQMLSTENYRGKRIRFTAYLKTQGNTTANLFIGSPFIGLEDRIVQTITGTHPWTVHTLDWQVPVKSKVSPYPGLLVFGSTLQGSGEIWLRDLDIQSL